VTRLRVPALERRVDALVVDVHDVLIVLKVVESRVGCYVSCIACGGCLPPQARLDSIFSAFLASEFNFWAQSVNSISRGPKRPQFRPKIDSRANQFPLEIDWVVFNFLSKLN
jgi:hypothetical protein